MKTTDLTAIAKRLNEGLGREVTTEADWQTVTEFWSIEDDLDQSILQYLLDRVTLLESRMEREHGWKR